MISGNWTKSCRSPRMWIELFALFNLAGLAPDIFLAHSINSFRAQSEYIPLVFSLAAPLLLIPAVWSLAQSRLQLWRGLGHFVGWTSVIIGITGLVLHLQSQFFQQWTLASLVYAAPFAAPLAYTGIGLLLIMNRMVDQEGPDWPHWVIFLALGGFVGNFVFSVTDHAQNGFFRQTEWIPVISSALAVGFLIVPLMMRVTRAYLRTCAVVMVLQVMVGIAGFVLHVNADLHAVGPTLFERIVHGAPIFAPLLFPNLALLAGIGMWVLYQKLPATESVEKSATVPTW
ncbi:MAG: hypothetical protein ABSG80_15025 [Verrucomicrobiota bacterium]